MLGSTLTSEFGGSLFPSRVSSGHDAVGDQTEHADTLGMQFAIPESQGGILQRHLGRHQLEGCREEVEVKTRSLAARSARATSTARKPAKLASQLDRFIPFITEHDARSARLDGRHSGLFNRDIKFDTCSQRTVRCSQTDNQ